MSGPARLRIAAELGAVLLLLVATLGPRVLALRTVWDQPLEPDAAAFHNLAVHPGSFYAASEREPLFIAFDRALLRAWPHPSAVRLQSLACSVLLGLLLGLIGWRIFKSKAAAAVPPLLFALTPYAVFMATRGLREEMFLCCALLYFDRMLAPPERALPRGALLALLGAGLLLTRESGLFFLLAGTALSALKVCLNSKNRMDRQAAARQALTYLIPMLAAAALAAPFFINQRRHFGELFHISRRDATFWRNQEFRDRPGHPTSAEVAADPYRGPAVSSFEYLFRDHSPGQAVRGMARGYWRALTFYYPHMLGRMWWLMLLSAPGIYRLWKLGRWEWILVGPLLLLPFSFILSLSVVGHQSVDARFAFAGYPPLLLLMGAGVDLLLSLRTRRGQSESATT